MFYADDNQEFYPAAQDPVSTNPYYWLWMGRGWRSFVVPYLSGVLKVLYCPSDETAPQLWESTSYGYSMAMYHSPAQINAMTDKSWCYSNPQPPVPQTMGWCSTPATRCWPPIEAIELVTGLDHGSIWWWGHELSFLKLFAKPKRSASVSTPFTRPGDEGSAQAPAIEGDSSTPGPAAAETWAAPGGQHQPRTSLPAVGGIFTERHSADRLLVSGPCK